jgi:hypothetical protein
LPGVTAPGFLLQQNYNSKPGKNNANRKLGAFFGKHAGKTWPNRTYSVLQVTASHA